MFDICGEDVTSFRGSNYSTGHPQRSGILCRISCYCWQFPNGLRSFWTLTIKLNVLKLWINTWITFKLLYQGIWTTWKCLCLFTCPADRDVYLLSLYQLPIVSLLLNASLCSPASCWKQSGWEWTWHSDDTIDCMEDCIKKSLFFSPSYIQTNDNNQ